MITENIVIPRNKASKGDIVWSPKTGYTEIKWASPDGTLITIEAIPGYQAQISYHLFLTSTCWWSAILLEAWMGFEKSELLFVKHAGNSCMWWNGGWKMGLIPKTKASQMFRISKPQNPAACICLDNLLKDKLKKNPPLHV